MEISFALAGLFSLLLVSVRIVAFLMVAPPFNSSSIPMRVRSMIAFAVALPLFPRYIDQVPAGSTYDLLWSITWQLLVGMSVGFMVQLMFSAFQAAGSLIDQFSMFAMASMLDPVSNTQSAVFGRIYSLLATTLLFATGGHLILVRGLLETFELLPVRPMELGALAGMVGTGLDRMFMAALQIGAPILAVLFLTDVALGLVSRAVPSLNIFQLSFPVKTMMVVSMAALGVSLMPAALDTMVTAIVREIPTVVGHLGG